MKQIGILAAIVLLGAGVWFFYGTETPSAIFPTQTVLLQGITVHVAVADTDAERSQGLSGVSSLKDDEGMLFIFDTDGIYSFWMKDMRFPIDILWFDAEGKVVHIEKNISPDTYPQSFTPGSLSRYVLELRAGFTDQYDIRIGSRATLPE